MPFGRRSGTASPDSPDAVGEPAVESGKGRPTPKRSEARKARRKPAPGNRKEAAERAREARQRARQALLTGDERYLPPRDAGPERRLARDIVDSRFTYGQVFIVVIVIVFFLGGFVPSAAVRGVANIAGLISLTVIVIDSARHGRRAKVAVTEKYVPFFKTGKEMRERLNG